MEIIRGLHNIRPHHKGCVATIGNFDGVHLGHQSILGRLRDKAAEYRVPSTVITFEPHPLEYFTPDTVLPRLLRFSEKMQLLAAQGVDRVLCIRFNARFAAVDAEAFVADILVQKLGIRFLAIGDDFRFGRQRRGDFAMLAQAGIHAGFEVERAPTFLLDEQRVSSSRVRKALMEGSMEQAARLLGFSYFISGRVAHGDKRGRQLGFPTANIHLRRKAVPVSGVFAVRIEGLADGWREGVANIGNRPTLDGTRSLLEVHLFDFDQEIYGAHLRVNLCHRIRDEQKFDSLAQLVAQIEHDTNSAKHYFATRQAR